MVWKTSVENYWKILDTIRIYHKSVLLNVYLSKKKCSIQVLHYWKHKIVNNGFIRDIPK